MARKQSKRAETPKEEPTTTVQEKPQYSFPSKARCPRCGNLKTQVRSTQGAVQYRQCSVPICRRRFKVVGTLVA